MDPLLVCYTVHWLTSLVIALFVAVIDDDDVKIVLITVAFGFCRVVFMGITILISPQVKMVAASVLTCIVAASETYCCYLMILLLEKGSNADFAIICLVAGLIVLFIIDACIFCHGVKYVVTGGENPMKPTDDIQSARQPSHIDGPPPPEGCSWQEIQIRSSQKMCACCLSTMCEEDNVLLLPCGHLFHTNCIRGWTIQSGLCCPLRCEEAECGSNEDEDAWARKCRLIAVGKNRGATASSITKLSDLMTSVPSVLSAFRGISSASSRRSSAIRVEPTSSGVLVGPTASGRNSIVGEVVPTFRHIFRGT